MSNILEKTFKGSNSQYQPISKIKNGGMSNVWNARDLNDGSPVVIKILLDLSLGNIDIKNKLLREAETNLVLRHQNICRLYDICECKDSVYRGLVVEHIDGLDLQDYLHYKKMSQTTVHKQDIFKIIYSIADALEYAHNLNYEGRDKIYKSVFHRDIKPANIVIGGKDIIKLIDFGTSSIETDQEVEFNNEYTRSYSSPDLWKGDKYLAHKYDARNDIYSLGLIFYELFTLDKALKYEGDEKSGTINYKKIAKFLDNDLYDFFCRWTHPEKEKRVQSTSEIKDFIHTYIDQNYESILDDDIQSAIKFEYEDLDHTILDTLMEVQNDKNVSSKLVYMYGYILELYLASISQQDKDLIKEYLDKEFIALTKVLEIDHEEYKLDLSEKKSKSLYDLMSVFFGREEIINRPYEEFNRVTRNINQIILMIDEALNLTRKKELLIYIMDSLEDSPFSFKTQKTLMGILLSSFNIQEDHLIHFLITCYLGSNFTRENKVYHTMIGEEVYNQASLKAYQQSEMITDILDINLKEIKTFFDYVARRESKFYRPMGLEKIQAIHFFLFSIANIDGSFDDKERKLIEQLTKIVNDDYTHTDISFEQNNFDNSIEKLNFDQQIYTYSLLIRVACADNILEKSELKYIYEFSNYIIKNKKSKSISFFHRMLIANTYIACSALIGKYHKFFSNELSKFEMLDASFKSCLFYSNAFRAALFNKSISVSKLFNLISDLQISDKHNLILFHIDRILQGSKNYDLNKYIQCEACEVTYLMTLALYSNGGISKSDFELIGEKLLLFQEKSDPDKIFSKKYQVTILYLIAYEAYKDKSQKYVLAGELKKKLESYVDKKKIHADDIRMIENFVSLLLKKRARLVRPSAQVFSNK